MDNVTEQTSYNTEIYKVKMLVRIDIRIAKPHSPWENYSESVIQIMKGKSKKIKFQRNIPQRFWGVGIVW